MDKNLKYYKVFVKIGHVGTGKYVETCLFFATSNIMEAVNLAKQTPGVKHRLLPFKTIQITKEEYIVGKEKDHYSTIMSSL